MDLAVPFAGIDRSAQRRKDYALFEIWDLESLGQVSGARGGSVQVVLPRHVGHHDVGGRARVAIKEHSLPGAKAITDGCQKERRNVAPSIIGRVDGQEHDARVIACFESASLNSRPSLSRLPSRRLASTENFLPVLRSVAVNSQ